MSTNENPFADRDDRFTKIDDAFEMLQAYLEITETDLEGDQSVDMVCPVWLEEFASTLSLAVVEYRLGEIDFAEYRQLCGEAIGYLLDGMGVDVVDLARIDPQDMPRA